MSFTWHSWPEFRYTITLICSSVSDVGELDVVGLVLFAERMHGLEYCGTLDVIGHCGNLWQRPPLSPGFHHWGMEKPERSSLARQFATADRHRVFDSTLGWGHRHPVQSIELCLHFGYQCKELTLWYSLEESARTCAFGFGIAFSYSLIASSSSMSSASTIGMSPCVIL